MSLFKNTKYINFHNNTSEDIIIEAWKEISCSLSSFDSKIIGPGEKHIIYSSVGEWIINNKKFYRIGKFRSDPCASGNYFWLDEDGYECVYTESNKNDIIGLMTFSKN
jgi:hypothetical protein